MRLDEEIRQQWFYEIIPRIMRRAGTIDWSATSQSENEELVQMIRRAEEGEESICMVNLMFEDNPYIPAHMKEIMHKTLLDMNEDQLAARYYGEAMMDQRQVYNHQITKRIQVSGFEN